MSYIREKTSLNPAQLPASVVSQEIMQPNPARIGLLLCAHSVVTVTFSWRNPATAGSGIVLTPGMHPVYLSREQLGSAIEQPLFVIASANNAIPVMAVEFATQGVNNE